MAVRKMPIGVQDFAKLRENNCAYADKTGFVYELASGVAPYFLGRPRRFGKSLLISTIKYYFQGRRDLFTGLKIAELETEWAEYPVFHIDLNIGNYTCVQDLANNLSTILSRLETLWGKGEDEQTLPARFDGLIRRAAEKSGRRVVVLIDEYDRPLIHTMENNLAQDDIRNMLKGFYGVLKSADPYLRFVMLTGVTKFSKVSVFSDLNQLEDISLDEKYAAICGITEQELVAEFSDEIHTLATKHQLTDDEVLREMRQRYNGYLFAPNCDRVYNPFSVINALQKQQLGNYWFATGTPTFLVKMLKDCNFDIPSLVSGFPFDMNALTDYRFTGDNPVPILYQSGYLTIKSYDAATDRYLLGFPNEEVKYAFLNDLLKSYIPRPPDVQKLYVGNFIADLRDHDFNAFMGRLGALFASIPYDTKVPSEHYFQSMLLLAFTLMGQFAQVEVHTLKGRTDAVVAAFGTVYVFEFKISPNATINMVGEALAQIATQDYAKPYLAANNRVLRIGAQYNLDKLELGEWRAE